ncbi:MAG: hypothetical protein ACWGMY_06880 [Hyphomicrobiaceae bacterium]
MIIELPEIACVLIHGCNHDTARAIATRHFADDEILEMGAASGEALLRALEPRIAAGKLTAIIEAGSPPGAHKLRVALASVARENYARRFGLILPDARPGEPNIDERLKADGYREVFEIPVGALDTFEIRRNRMPTDVRHEHGPFDIIGDVHGCGDELVDLLEGSATRSPGRTRPIGKAAALSSRPPPDAASFSLAISSIAVRGAAMRWPSCTPWSSRTAPRCSSPEITTSSFCAGWRGARSRSPMAST